MLVLAAVSLSFIGLAGPAAGAQTLDITGLSISPNPGYECENTTISFNVTNNLGTVVEFITVNVATKSSVGGMSWQSNITMLANGASSFQSFVWTNPPAGTYDVSITVIGAGQIAQKSGIYTVLPCAAHVYIGSVTIIKSTLVPGDNATVRVEVGNDGHAPAFNTTVAAQATGPYPDATRYFIGSTVVPRLDEGSIGRIDIFWQTLPEAGVYNLTALAIDDSGIMAAKKGNLTTLQSPQVPMNSVRVVNIAIDPYPPMEGQESNVTVDLIFQGNWSGVPVTVKAIADGSSSYFLFCVTLKEVMVESLVSVNFSWPAAIEPGDYHLSVSVFGFNPQEVTTASKTVRQMAKQKAWLPSNFRLDIKGLRMTPYPPLPGQNTTVTVDIQNTGDADAPPASLTVTAEGPVLYNLGTRTTPNTSFGTMVRMEFNWTQPIVPGEYTIRAFLEDAGGNQSELRKTFPMPHILESNMSIVNGSSTYNYYYYGGAPNGSQGQNITVVVPATLNETEPAATGLANPAMAGAAGVAAGALVSIGTVLAYGLAKRKGQMTNLGSNPMYNENANAGQNPLYQDKGMAGENPLYIHERMVHGIHRGEGVDESQGAALVGGALPGGAVISSAVSSGIRESPSRPSQGQTAVRESPTKASTGGVTAREAGSGMATGKRQYEPVAVTDEDGDIGSDARMAINEKGLPGKKKPSTQRLAGDGTGPIDDDSDDDGLPDVQGMAINEKGLPGDKKKTNSQARTAGGGGDDMPTESLDQSRKGWDGTIKGVTSDEGVFGREAIKHPSMPETPDMKGDFSRGHQPDTKRTYAPPHVFEQNGSQTSGVRESPTLPSRDQASGQASGIAIDESGTQVVHSRDVATGQAPGLRESPTRPSLGQTKRESPTGSSDFGINEQGIKAPQQSFEKGDKGTGAGGTEPDGKLSATDMEAQKHTKTGHVTLMK